MISLGNKYTIGKYNDKSISGSNSNWQNLEGDHTHSDDKNRGYFLMLDCPQGCGGTTGVTCASNFWIILRVPYMKRRFLTIFVRVSHLNSKCL